MPPSPTYSLWLMPTGELYHRLAETIARLSDAHDAPKFKPHVTLLGGLAMPEEEILAQTARLAERLKPYRLKLTTLATGEAHFQCLYILVKPTRPVMATHRQAKEVFNRLDEPGYMPHLSLLYGHYPEQVKQAIITGLGDSLQGEFAADSLHLHNTSGQPHLWSRVRTYPLR